MVAFGLPLAALAVGVLSARRVLWLLRGPKCDFATHKLRLPDRAFSGKVCWITGASSGIGRALAASLASRGALLILTSRRASALATVAGSLPCPRSSVLVLPADLAAASTADLHHLAATAAAAFGGRLDYLFHNAGVSTRATAAEFDPANLDAVTRLDYVAPAVLTQACVGALRVSGGAVVVTSSLAAIVSTPLRAPYCAAKAAVARFHECLALEELGGGGVDVVNVYPGSVRTEVARNALVGRAGETFGATDVNIENGLDVEYAAERMAAAAHNRVRSAWIAKGRELLGTYLAYYAPWLWGVAAPRMARKYQAEILASRSSGAAAKE